MPRNYVKTGRKQTGRPKKADKKVYIPTGKPRGRAHVPDGTVRTYTNKRGEQSTHIKSGNRWVYVKGSNVGTGKKCGNPGKRIQDKAEGIVCQPRAKEVAKRAKDSTRQIHHKSPKALENGYNPNSVKVKEQTGGKWVRVNDKTIVYRLNRAV